MNPTMITYRNKPGANLLSEQEKREELREAKSEVVEGG
jgi:PHD/YefM family antitoxin component YafN of YafNO toxin-antitoxin module